MARDAGFLAIPEHVRLDMTDGAVSGSRAIASSMNLPGERAYWTVTGDQRVLTWMTDRAKTEISATFAADDVRGIARFVGGPATPSLAHVTGVRTTCFDVSQADSADVVVAAFDSVMGTPPFAHPAGSTSTFCLTLREGARTDAARDTQPSFTERALRTIGRRGTLTAGRGCIGRAAPSFGSWTVDVTGAPAVHVVVSRPQFSTPLSARIRMSATRGGRWGHSMQCDVTRPGLQQSWTVRGCRILMVS